MKAHKEVQGEIDKIATCAIVKNAINIIALACAANSGKITDLLAEYLFSQEEVELIKKSTGERSIEDNVELWLNHYREGGV